MASFVPVGVTATVKDVQKFQKKLGLMQGAVIGVGFAITKFALDSAVAMTKALVGIGKASFDAAVEFESSFAGVRKTVDTTEEEFANLQQSFRDLSKTVPIDVNEINKIAEMGGQLGVVGEDTEDVTGTLTKFAETIAALGVSTDLTTDAAATQLARFANIMGTTAEFGDETYSRLGSTIVDLGNKFATTESDVTNFGTRIAGAGKIAGLTEADVFAIGAAMSSVGVQAEAGGTAVQKTLLAMNEAVINGGDQLEIFAGTAGMATEDFADLWEKDAGAGFEAFVEGLGEMGDDALFVLDELGLKDQRLIRSFLSLANAGDLLERTMDSANTAFEENTALTTEAEKRYATTESQMIIMKNTLHDMGITIGSVVIPIFNELLTAARPFIDQMGAFLSVIGDEFLRGFGTGSEQGGLLQGVIAGITEVLDNFIPEESMEKIWGFIDGLQQMWTWLSANLPGAIATAGGFFQEVLIPAFQIAVGWIKENLVPVFQTLQSWFTQVLPLAIGMIATKWEEILLPAIMALAEVWKTDIQPALELLWEWLKVNIPPIIESLSVLFETVLQPAMKVIGTFISETLIPIIGNLVGKILTALIPILDTLVLVWNEALLPAIQAIWGFIEANLIPVITALAELIGAALSLALDVIIGLFTALNDYLQENLAPHMEAFGKWLTETFGPALEGIKEALKGLATWFQTLKDKITNISLPDWMKPGSPTPLEIGLRGISAAMKELTTSQLPKFKAELDLLGGPMGATAMTPMVSAPQAMSSNNISVQVGPNTISDQIDQAIFENRVLRVVEGAIG
ncbi:MAG: phage tail tape measure protein [Candidatus Thorarchaeota archaeon]|jgi:TP901 family phage tail tape measure protein